MKKILKGSLALAMAFGGVGTLQAAGSLAEAIEDTTINNVTFMRYTTKTGLGNLNDKETGNRTQLRSWFDLDTGKIDGYQLHLGVMFNQGSGMPLSKSNNSSHTDLLGTGVSHFSGDGNVNTINDNLNMFGISQAYIKKDFDEDGKHNGQIGMMYIKSPFNDGMMDRGLGGVLNFSLGGTKLNIQAYDTWIGMDLSFMHSLSGSALGGGSNFNNALAAFNNNLFIAGVQNSSGALDYKFYLAHISNMLDFTSFLDLGYKFGDGFRLGVQASYAEFGRIYSGQYGSSGQIDAGQKGNHWGGYFKTKNPGGNVVAGMNSSGTGKAGLARSAGLANIQLSYNQKGGAKFKIGYTGSFGDSYGVSIDNQGAYNLGGWLWHNMLVFGGNGASMFGSGAVKGANISVAYLMVGYDITDNFKFTLDIAHVGGVNNIWGNDNNFTKSWANRIADGGSRRTAFTEFTPQINWQLNERLELIGIYSHAMGDLKLNIAQAMLRFKY